MKLKPCPFCGGEAELIDMSDDNWGNPYQICCENKCELGETNWYTECRKDELIKAWNQRIKEGE